MEYLIALTLFLAPTYVIRFDVFGLPTNLLMLWVPLVWLIFALWIFSTGRFSNFRQSVIFTDRRLLWLVAVFFSAGTVALFIGGFSQEKLGQYIVWFVEPLTMFFIARFLAQKFPAAKSYFISAIYFFLLVSGVYAMVQYFTLHGLPPAWWGNSDEPKRALSFFAHPNDYALFIAPLLAFLLPDVFARIKNFRLPANSAVIFAWIAGAIGLLFSFSRGGWLGLVAALAMFVLVSGNKKTAQTVATAVVIVAIVIALVPNLRYRVILPFYGERSSVARLALWRTGWHMVQDNPALGKGLLGADHNWARYAVDPPLGHYPFPHNIFLDFWIDTGLLGLISFIALAVYGLWHGWKHRANMYAFGLMLFLVALLVHGQIDNPYFKNDLALAFWLVWAMIL
jgi:putative inorganic carbon (HCO3(-)) transporter